MPICKKLKSFLDDNNVRYTILVHSPAYTAPEIAASAHIKGRSLVKCVMVNGDGQHYMVALTANQKVRLEKLREALAVREVQLEREEDFRKMFADCEPGAMPPFGNIYGLPVIADKALYEDEEIAFNGGNHTSIVKMTFADFERLVTPKKADIAV
jgi:Ala-tRNA(Pro) deacylase